MNLENFDKINREEGTISLNSSQAMKLLMEEERCKYVYYFNVPPKYAPFEKMLFSMLKSQFIPFLHEMAQKYHPDIYKMYQGNICRQASFYVMEAIMEIAYDWKIEVVEYNINDIIMGQAVRYEHATLFITFPNGEHRFVNMWEKYVPDQWLEMDVMKYPTFLEEYKNSEVIETTTYTHSVVDNMVNGEIIGPKATIRKEMKERFRKNFKLLRNIYIGSHDLYRKEEDNE